MNSFDLLLQCSLRLFSHPKRLVSVPYQFNIQQPFPTSIPHNSYVMTNAITCAAAATCRINALTASLMDMLPLVHANVQLFNLSKKHSILHLSILDVMLQLSNYFLLNIHIGFVVLSKQTKPQILTTITFVKITINCFSTTAYIYVLLCHFFPLARIIMLSTSALGYKGFGFANIVYCEKLTEI